eukprot:2260037-Pyramimonas_sp.AAC.1
MVFLELFAGSAGLSSALRLTSLDVVLKGWSSTWFALARRGIKNWERARQQELVGVELAIFSAEVARECQKCRVSWSIENPRGSKIWAFHPICELCRLPGVVKVVLDQCQYSVPWKKPTM